MRMLLAIASAALLIWLLVRWFNREPAIRRVAAGLVAPAYGRVYRVLRGASESTVSIVLTLLDVHAQYYPIGGIVISHTYDATGQLALVFDLNKSAQNEKVVTRLRADSGDEVRVTQIAGLAARRIQWRDRTGQRVAKGAPLGRILLGSRVDVSFPRRWRVVVREGDYVHGPESTLALL